MIEFKSSANNKVVKKEKLSYLALKPPPPQKLWKAPGNKIMIYIDKDEYIK